MSGKAQEGIRVWQTMAAIVYAAVLMAAYRADAFVTMFVMAFPFRLGLIAWFAGVRLARGERGAAVLPSWLAFLGDEKDERRFVRMLGLSLCVDALIVGLWPIWREGARDLGVLLTSPWVQPEYAPISSEWQFIAHDIQYWKGIWSWEAWSLARWWLLFGLLTLVTVRLSRRERPASEAAIALLRFSPWLIVLEFGYLVGVWLARRSVGIMPEPSTTFASDWEIRMYGVLRYVPFWLRRGGLPSLIVGLAFFRMVPGWRWVAAVVGSIVLVPVALGLSMLWAALGAPLWAAHN
jgi:hypothetical protein